MTKTFHSPKCATCIYHNRHTNQYCVALVVHHRTLNTSHLPNTFILNLLFDNFQPFIPTHCLEEKRINRLLSIQPCTNNSIIILPKRVYISLHFKRIKEYYIVLLIRMRTFSFANANECGYQLVFAAKTKPDF